MEKIKQNKISRFVRKNWKFILAVVFTAMLIYKINQTFFTKPEIKKVADKEVELINITKVDKPYLENQCKITSSNTVNLTAETGGKVTKVYKKVNDKVKKGDLILSLKSLQQQASIQNAKVALQQAELALKDMVENTSGKNYKELEKQQEKIVKNAYRTFLNNDLQFYPEEEDETSPAPTVSGSYSCLEEGTYVLETYSSASDSGGSFRFSGLESGVETIYTQYAVNLGNCGLQVKFPSGFKKDVNWVLEIPNKKSSSYQSAKQSYELAQQNKNVSLDSGKVTDEQVKQQEGRVTQAKLNLQIAYDNYAKTQIRATSNGVLTDFDINTGDTVSSGTSVATIKGLDDITAEGFFDENEVKYISENSEVYVNDKKSKINSIGSVFNDSQNKMKVTISVDSQEFKNQDGQYVDCKIKIDNFDKVKEEKTIVPLSALSVIGDEYYIFYVQNNQIQKQEVKAGGIFGDKVEIYDFDNKVVNIIKDTRGLYEGKIVKIKE